jgi:hypothetical protein
MRLLHFENYEEYKQTQIAANECKFGEVFAEISVLRRIAAHVRRRSATVGVGLCHGVRNGYEVRRLRRLLPRVDIIGTDISGTAARIPNCIVWDMHDVKPEWRGAVDFMYSNSWDHTYDPELLLTRWSECLSPSGRLYLSYTDLHSERGVVETSKSDPFGCSLDELIRMVQHTYTLDDILEVRPQFTYQAFTRRMAHIRARRFTRALTARLRSRRVQVLVLRRRT